MKIERDSSNDLETCSFEVLFIVRDLTAVESQWFLDLFCDDKNAMISSQGAKKIFTVSLVNAFAAQRWIEAL
jgi:hypothetical protein